MEYEDLLGFIDIKAPILNIHITSKSNLRVPNSRYLSSLKPKGPRICGPWASGCPGLYRGSQWESQGPGAGRGELASRCRADLELWCLFLVSQTQGVQIQNHWGLKPYQIWSFSPIFFDNVVSGLFGKRTWVPYKHSGRTHETCHPQIWNPCRSLMRPSPSTILAVAHMSYCTDFVGTAGKPRGLGNVQRLSQYYRVIQFLLAALCLSAVWPH